MDRRVRRELGSHVFDPLCECALVCEKQAVSAADVMNLLTREATPPQTDDVEAREMGAIPERHSVRNDIILDRRHASDEGMLADPHELMDPGAAADDHEVAD